MTFGLFGVRHARTLRGVRIAALTTHQQQESRAKGMYCVSRAALGTAWSVEVASTRVMDGFELKSTDS